MMGQCLDVSTTAKEPTEPSVPRRPDSVRAILVDALEEVIDALDAARVREHEKKGRPATAAL